MKIGVPKEIKNNENRVALTPAGVRELVKKGHTVYVQNGAGFGSGFSDEEYVALGAKMIESAEGIFSSSDMIVKVKEPIGNEIEMLKDGKILFTYLHLAADKELTAKLMKQDFIGIAYETVERDNELPLLAPMSEVAGRIAPLIGAYYLMRPKNGNGTLISGVPGTAGARVVVLGGGHVGKNAALMAYNMGARVTILEISSSRIRHLKDIMPFATVLYSNEYNISETLHAADILIGGVLVPGAKAPTLVTKEMLKNMNRGGVVIDVAIDQGGCIETIRPTSHSDPVYDVDGIIHYGVTNMPGAYPRTSTIALTSATLPYMIKIADKGMDALKNDPGFMKGLNIFRGKITYRAVAESLGLEYTEPEKAIGAKGFFGF